VARISALAIAVLEGADEGVHWLKRRQIVLGCVFR
jgi:hypothetical protein